RGRGERASPLPLFPSSPFPLFPLSVLGGPPVKSSLPPVIILGGEANAVSIARCLGRRGVPVYAVNEHAAPVRHSRYCRWLPVPWLGSNEASWTAYLLGPEAEPFRGAVLLAASDDALEILTEYREPLSRKFLLDE